MWIVVEGLVCRFRGGRSGMGSCLGVVNSYSVVVGQRSWLSIVCADGAQW